MRTCSVRSTGCSTRSRRRCPTRVWAYPEEAYEEFRFAVARWAGADPAQVIPGHGIQALTLSLVAALGRAGRPGRDPAADLRPVRVGLRGGGRIGDPGRPRAGHARVRSGGARPHGRRGRRQARVRLRSEQPDRVAGQPSRLGCVRAVAAGAVPRRRRRSVCRLHRALGADRPAGRHRRRPSRSSCCARSRRSSASPGCGSATCSCRESLAPHLHAVQEPFNVNCAALAAGLASLERVDALPARRAQAVVGAGAARRAAGVGRDPHACVARELRARRGRRR